MWSNSTFSCLAFVLWQVTRGFHGFESSHCSFKVEKLSHPGDCSLPRLIGQNQDRSIKSTPTSRVDKVSAFLYTH